MNLIKTVPLVRGFRIGDLFYTQAFLREATTADVLDAEDHANPADKPLNYSAALLVRQLVQAETADGKKFGGPFSVGMIRNLTRGDFARLRAVQQELNAEGESEPESAPESGTAFS
jgi:phage FluMu protein gp41